MELNQNTEKLDNYRKRAAELVGKMTLEEKVAQTLYQAPDILVLDGTVKYKGL